MKEEAKRQQESEMSPPASGSTTTTASANTFTVDEENTQLSRQTPTSTDAAQDSPAPGDSSGDSTRGEPLAVRFDYSNVAFVEGSDFYLDTTNAPTVPVEVNPVVGNTDNFDVVKQVCRLVAPDVVPVPSNCLPLTSTRSKDQASDTTSEKVSFQVVDGFEAYYLRFVWTSKPGQDDEGRAGYSFSRVFGKPPGDKKLSDVSVQTDWSDVKLFDNVPLLVGSQESGQGQPFTISWDEGAEYVPPHMRDMLEEAVDKESPKATSAVAGTSPTASPSATNAAGGEGDVSDATASGSGGGGGGLQKGAIIGIAVAASIVGLAAIGLLVWFFCLRNRRRRGSNDHGPYAAPDHQASEYMVNKETTGAHVTESPHSPYSDNGSLAHAQGQGPSSLAQAQQTNQYSDAPPIAAPVPRSASQQAGDRPGSGEGTRSGTPGGHNVSHLIEEGMTEADIRRLEEEERALDDAIERAGHGRRQA